jgi:hypothetical protein
VAREHPSSAPAGAVTLGCGVARPANPVRGGAGSGDLRFDRRPRPGIAISARPRHRRLPRLPAEQSLAREGREPPAQPALERVHRVDRRKPRPAPGLRSRARLRDPLRGRPGRSAEGPDPLHRLRRPVEPGALPDPAQRPGRGRPERRRRPPCPCPPEGHLHALRDVGRPPECRRLVERRVGRRLRPALEPAATKRLDLGRRRRPIGLRRPDPLRRDPEGIHQPRDPLHGTRDPGRLHPPGDPLRLGLDQPRPAANGAAAAARGELPDHRLSPHRQDHSPGDEDLRADPRRQRQPLVLPGRDRPALERHDPRPAEERPRASPGARSRSSRAARSSTTADPCS